MPATTCSCHRIQNFKRRLLASAVFALLGLSAQAQSLPLAVASPIDSGRETRESSKSSPSSALDARSALIAATTIASRIPGGIVMTVMPTGSMRPMFDEKAFLVLEPAAFDSLQVGDIITFQHPKLGVPVVHRVFEKHGGSLWTKGDYNSRPDNIYVTSANYRMRVVAVIYAREGNASLAMTGSAVRSATMMN